MPALTARVCAWRRVRGPLAAFALALGTLLLSWRILEAHAKLLSSDPAAGAILSAPPSRVRLLFSESVEPRLSAVSLIGADGRSILLPIRLDSADAHVLVAPLEGLTSGEYRVQWRVVSSDGHPSQGSFRFTLSAPAGSAAMSSDTAHADAGRVSTAPSAPTSMMREMGPTIAGAPVLLSAARGLGVGALMGTAGLLLFLLWNDGRARRPRHLAAWLAFAAVILLAGETALWLVHTSLTGRLDAGWARTALGTAAGSRELWRMVLALLALGSLVPARRPALGLTFATLALVVSGAIGHPAAIDPTVAIPAKVLHLFGAALWFGGLLWLIARERDDAMRYRLEALRVSTAALIAVIVVAISGVVQTVLFLDSPSALFRSPYGWVVLLKVAGLVVLVLFGAYHRYRVLPRLHASADARRLGRSVGREVVVLVIVLLLGGLLANIAPPGVGTG